MSTDKKKYEKLVALLLKMIKEKKANEQDYEEDYDKFLKFINNHEEFEPYCIFMALNKMLGEEEVKKIYYQIVAFLKQIKSIHTLLTEDTNEKYLEKLLIILEQIINENNEKLNYATFFMTDEVAKMFEDINLLEKILTYELSHQEKQKLLYASQSAYEMVEKNKETVNNSFLIGLKRKSLSK